MTTATHGYDVHTIPAAPGDGSRYAVATSPAGHAIQPDKNIGLAYNKLLGERRAQAGGRQPETIRVALRQASRVGGEYVLEDRGEVAGVPSVESARPGKRWRKLEGGALLDSFFLGTEAFENAPDLEVWEALRVVCEADGIGSGALRQVNDYTAILVALRAGLTVSEESLPHPKVLVRGG